MNRFLVAEDLSAEQTWRLLDWCAKNGANELAVSMLSVQNRAAPLLEQFEEAVKPFKRSTAPREALTAPVGELLVRPTQLWSLEADTMRILLTFFTHGLFMYPTAEWEEGCLEDPTFYRDGALMFGVVSHEHEGVLRLSEREHAEVAALGIPTRDQAQWI